MGKEPEDVDEGFEGLGMSSLSSELNSEGSG